MYWICYFYRILRNYAPLHVGQSICSLGYINSREKLYAKLQGRLLIKVFTKTKTLSFQS